MNVLTLEVGTKIKCCGCGESLYTITENVCNTMSTGDVTKYLEPSSSQVPTLLPHSLCYVKCPKCEVLTDIKLSIMNLFEKVARNNVLHVGVPAHKLTDLVMQFIEDYRVKVKMRGFEVAKGFEDKGVEIPQRNDAGSAGYDIKVLDSATILPMQQVVFRTGLKAYMSKGDVLKLYPRSSLGIKRNVILSNLTGIIDESYYGNESNDGHIMIALRNLGTEPVFIEAGEKVAQGIFEKYYLTDDDLPVNDKRIGGVGSSGK